MILIRKVEKDYGRGFVRVPLKFAGRDATIMVGEEIDQLTHYLREMDVKEIIARQKDFSARLAFLERALTSLPCWGKTCNETRKEQKSVPQLDFLSGSHSTVDPSSQEEKQEDGSA